MRVIEIMGIEQARKWGVCTMNEFREFVGLKKFSDFKEWNRTGDIAVRFLAGLENDSVPFGCILNLALVHRKSQNSSINISTISSFMCVYLFSSGRICLILLFGRSA